MDYLDIMSGVDFLVEIGLADPQRLGVAGLSYGGYMTNWIVGHTDRFKAAVSISGIFTLASDFSNSSFPAWEREYLGAYYWEDREAYDAMSPGTCVKNIRTPVLIIHGDEDNNTFVTNSQELYQALFHMGRTVQFVRYPREGHELEEPNHILDAMEREIRWFDRYIMGREWRVRLGEWAEGEALSARVDGWSAEPEIREAGRAHAVQEKGDERYVLVLRVRGSGGEVLHPCRDVAVIDKDENQWAPAGVLAGEGKSRYSMKGDIAVTLEQEREIVISLIFDLPPKAGGLRLSVRDLPLMQLSPP
jgi:dienelactone hydrolase